MGCQIVKLRKVHRRTMVGKEIVMGTQEYFKAYDAVAYKHGIGIREMLVLLKAYAQYKADEGLGRSVDERGWMNDVYDILSCLNRFGEGSVYIPDSFVSAKDFWEPDSDKAHWRLSAAGLKFVNDNPDLIDAAMSVLVAVVNHN